jgi:asparagine synthase (glutamine-hydrolysing)
MDEPIDHPNSVGVHALCRQAHGQVTVLLSGQGADELLGGYERYRTATVTHALSRRVPRALRAAVRHLPPGRTYGRGESLERAARMEPEETLLLSSAYVDPALLRVLGVAGDPVGDFRRTALARSPGTPLERLLFYDLDTYLASLLQRDDKMSMAASIENRVPYLERRVVEACVRIHPTHKRVDRDGKRVLRAVAGRLLDAPAVPTGRKIGFAAPVASWLQLPGLAERLEGFGRGQGRITSLVSAELVAFARKGLGQGHRQATELAWMLMTVDHHLDALASAASRAAAVPASRGLQ